MKIIPVIDLLNNEVVRGIAGNRAHYQPINTPLCQSSHPVDVITAFLQRAAFDTIYIADLNALRGNTPSVAMICALFEHFPTLKFWLDGGFKTRSDFEPYVPHPGFVPILATETIKSVTQYQTLISALGAYNCVLSLDHKAGPIGLEALFAEPALWPQHVIVMSLDDVGRDSGPNFELIARYQKISKATQIVAAGGVRNDADLAHLDKQGVSAVLVASAIHSGKLDCNSYV